MYLFCKWLDIRHLRNHVKSTCQYTQKQAIACNKNSKIAYISNIIITKSLLLLADNRCKLVIWSNKDINRTFVQIEYSIISYIMHDGMYFNVRDTSISMQPLLYCHHTHSNHHILFLNFHAIGETGAEWDTG
jgi:hypothetical protein